MDFDTTLICVLAVVLVATTIRATLGFGDALTAMPLLSMIIDLRDASALVALTSATLATAMAVRHRRSVRLKSVWQLLASAIVGIPLGFFLLTLIDERIVTILLAVLVVGFAAFQLRKVELESKVSRRWAYLFGLLSGLLGGAYNIFGPPIVIYATLRGWTAEQFRATMQSYFLPVVAVLLVFHFRAGNLTPRVCGFFLSTLPILVISFTVGGLLHKRINEQRFRRIVLVGLIVIGCSLFVKGLLGGPSREDAAVSTPTNSMSRSVDATQAMPEGAIVSPPRLTLQL